MNVLTTKKYSNFKMDGFKNFILEKFQEVNLSIEENTLCGDVCLKDIENVLEELGFGIVKNTFHGYIRLFSMSEVVAVRIGTKMIMLNDTKTIGFLIEEIETACMVQLEKQAKENCLLQELISQDYFESVLEQLNSSHTYEEYIALANKSSVADKEFEETLKGLGYTIEERKVLEGYEETCSCVCIENSVIKFAEVNKQGTLYRNVQLRERVEILYILVCIKYGENIFADEF